MYIIGLAPTPSFTTFGVTRFIGTRVAPFHPQVVLFTVTTLGIILGGNGFKSVMVGALNFGSVTINGIVTKISTTRITPVLPLPPWSIWVPTDGPASDVGTDNSRGCITWPLELVLFHPLEQAFQFI